MSFCTPRGDVEQEEKRTDKGERLHVCDRESAGELCFPQGWLWFCCEFWLFLLGGGWRGGFRFAKMLRQEQILVAQSTCISRAQSQSLLQGKQTQKKKQNLSLFNSLQCCTYALRPIISFLFFSEIPEVGWHSGKWHCTVRDRLWLLEVGVGLQRGVGIMFRGAALFTWNPIQGHMGVLCGSPVERKCCKDAYWFYFVFSGSFTCIW